MVRPKLSFEVDADKDKAIADYVRTHVSSISFLGKAKGLKVKSAILTSVRDNELYLKAL